MPVYQDKRGRWHVAFMQGRRRVHRVCPEGTSKAKAVEWETQLRQQVFKIDRLGEIPDYSLGEAILRYLEEGPQTWRHDLESKARALGPWVVGKMLREAADVAEEYKRDTRDRHAAATINRRLALLRRVANLAYSEWQWLAEPVGMRIKLLRGEARRETYLSKAQIARLVKAIAHPQARAAVMIAAYAGLRSAEILALRPEDARGGTLHVTTGKTGRLRLVPVVSLLRPWLKLLPIGLHASTLSHAVARALPGVRFHDLRHSCASLLINAGVDLYTVGKILGHSQPNVTQRYAHLQLRTLKKAMNKLK